MKITITLILLTIGLLISLPMYASDSDPVITKLGEYHLDAETTLVLSVDPMQGVTYALTSQKREKNITGTTTTSSIQATGDEPFLFYWDTIQSRLWWATAKNIGFLDHSSLSDTESAVYPRTAASKVKDIPGIFLQTVLKTFP